MLNKFLATGRATNDPKLSESKNGLGVVTFTIAVDDNRKSPSGEKQTLFLDCVYFAKSEKDKTPENISKYVSKGSLIAICGKIATRRYVKQDGTQGIQVQCFLEETTFLEGKKDEGDAEEVTEAVEIAEAVAEAEAE